MYVTIVDYLCSLCMPTHVNTNMLLSQRQLGTETAQRLAAVLIPEGSENTPLDGVYIFQELMRERNTPPQEVHPACYLYLSLFLVSVSIRDTGMWGSEKMAESMCNKRGDRGAGVTPCLINLSGFSSRKKNGHKQKALQAS